MPKNKKNQNKPKPSDLGSGAASHAAKKLKGRKKQLEDILNAASGGKQRKGMKKTKGRK